MFSEEHINELLEALEEAIDNISFERDLRTIALRELEGAHTIYENMLNAIWHQRAGFHPQQLVQISESFAEWRNKTYPHRRKVLANEPAYILRVTDEEVVAETYSEITLYLSYTDAKDAFLPLNKENNNARD